MGMVQEFREFAMKGSLVDMAVGIIIGAAVTEMVGALVDSVIMPIVGIFMGGLDFSSLAITVGEANIRYGEFIQALINFVIVAFVIFMILKAINKMRAAEQQVPEEITADVQLLGEIRDLLKNR
jgi:large conductance mechanosensitive channel